MYLKLKLYKYGTKKARLNVLKTFTLGLAILFCPHILALGGTDYVYFNALPAANTDNDVAIVAKKGNATLYLDAADYRGVHHATNNLRDDINKVTGQSLNIHSSLATAANNQHAVIIGTIGKSPLIDQFIKNGMLDVSSVKGTWEAYLIQTVNNPAPGIQSALIIAGADKRGTIYGIYSLTEKIGVSPWHWWADVPVKTAKHLYVKNPTKIFDAPKVQYRGIFLNDEAPALTNWVQQNYGNYNHKFYLKVFELMLRLKANYLWPAMWNNAFNTDDPLNTTLADEYGIVMGTSHHEPMMRAHKEWTWTGEGPWDYAKNKDTLQTFWLDGVTRNSPYESIITLGMRGDGDEPMSENDNIALLENIVKDQRALITQAYQRPAQEVPQIWALYKEVQGYYEQGMRVPDDVTLLWADDNWGNVRRLPTPEERNREGGAGVYYHFDYVGGPRSYRWINTVPIAKVWEQLYLAYQTNARKIWIVNVGDLKPMEFPIEFFMHYAWNPERWPKENLTQYGELWAAREFGQEHAKDIAQLIQTYTRHNGRRKPEQQSPDTYSLLHYHEAQGIEQELTASVKLAETLYQKLPAQYKDAFYQLVLYPVKASATLTQLYIATAKNRLYALQGRAIAPKYKQMAEQLFQQDAELEREYHSQLSLGKWNHFMSQPHIGYTHWNDPEADTMPVTFNYQASDPGDMGIAIEGMATAWPQQNSSTWPHDGSYRLQTFSFHGQQEKHLTLYNRGKQPYEFSANTSAPWIKLSQQKGTVTEQVILKVSVDWQWLRSQQTDANLEQVSPYSGEIAIKGTGWGQAKIRVQAQLPSKNLLDNAKGFVESDGVIAIEAANFDASIGRNGISWQTIPNHGRTVSSISTFPFSDKVTANKTEAPYVEYPLYFFTAGRFEIEFLLAPTLRIFPDFELKFAYSLAPTNNKHNPETLAPLSEFNHSQWQQAVSNAVHKVKGLVEVEKPGAYHLRIYRVDPAVTLQKIIVNTGGLRASYLGPPESRRL